MTPLDERPFGGADVPDFLADMGEPLRPAAALPSGFALRGIFLGGGNPALEVMALDADHEPRSPTLREIWKARQRGRAAPLVVAALRGGEAWLCGPVGDAPRVFPMDTAQAERVCRRALEEPDRNAALRYLLDALPASLTDTDLPGFRNEGLLTDHVLRTHPDGFATELEEARQRGAAAAGAKDAELLRRLGFGIERLNSVTSVLRVGEQKRAVAVLLHRDEVEEAHSARFQGSPIAWALDTADREGLPWVVTVQADRVRLYPRELGVGVGRRGRTDTWVEARTDLIRQDQVALLWLAFSAPALMEGGTLQRLLEHSQRFAARLADRLRERIYDEVVPRLATGIARARGVARPDTAALRLTYGMALTVLFRLLFVAYAEDRDFLPRDNAEYRRFALKTLAGVLHGRSVAPGTGAERWADVNRLFDAVRDGRRDWDLPAYGGALFSADPAVSPAGAELARVALPDAAFEPALRALLLNSPDDLAVPGGPVDFRSLRVREFGTIYEGLLESELALAEEDLALRRQGGEAVYAPAKPGEPVAVRSGETYLHNRSGARKSTGSYYTPDFAVDHLLDAALAPALAAHAERVTALDDTEAAAAFFDFRVADIAMGSGHFLVAAMDRVEQAFSALLQHRPLPGVAAELATLREAARKELGPLAEATPIADGQLLRRLIAMRCLYGVDLNPLAVDLARLSLWIHGFVPGLPLAMLEARLRHGNALVGVATVRQLEDRLRESGTLLFPVDADSLLGDAKVHLARRARLADTTPRDVQAARDAVQMAEVVLLPTRALCDLVVANRIWPKEVPFQFEDWPKLKPTIQRSPKLARARELLRGLDVLHFPVAFPEVFLGANPGFDVVLGNPPWEKVRTERHEFWARHFPGLRGIKGTTERDKELSRLAGQRPDLVALEAAEREAGEAFRNAVRALPGMNTGHPDLFRAFAGRFTSLVKAEGGRFGVVLPGEAFKVKGNGPVRAELGRVARRVDVQMLTNRAEWVFPQVHPQKPIALVAAEAGEGATQGCMYVLRPEFHHLVAFRARRLDDAAERPAAWLRRYSEGLVQPTLPSAPATASMAVIEALMRAPRIAAHPVLRVRRVYADAETSRDRDIYGAEPGPGTWPVYGGDSFDLWQPDTGLYYATAREADALERVQRKRANSPRGAPYAEMPRRWRDDPRTHPCNAPRIAFRNVTNRTNRRTLLAALIPANVILVETAPWLLWLDPGRPLAQEAFLLGVMSSLVADWWMRRFVETHVEEAAFNALPVPAADPSTGLAARTVTLSARLAAPDERFAAWAAAVGVAHGPLAPAEKQAMIEELDAVVAYLYDLGPEQLGHVFDTFHEWPREAERQAWAARRDRTVALLKGLA